ncbi:MAG: putative activity regulator of membrane protease YbbK [Candidatus Carbobacillus altaicus]|uniref:Putative activity regulator of membrane protease YbbK n=1 Tax=Candidatus Carbonibacillus altaicus TaxID=2163959 RepID=A0A2R6XXF0_9BACL|nr:MAG: putative activity regulator of membrane protease YbbK [Candidatus Carbobacillus altaicus]
MTIWHVFEWLTHPIFWFILGFILLIIEVMTVTFVLLWIGIGALLTGLVTLFSSNLALALATFVVSSTVLWVFTRPLTRRLRQRSPKVESGVYALIGKTTVAETSFDDQESGSVRLMGDVWRAKSIAGRIAAGSPVKVVRVEGVTLYVEPLNDDIASDQRIRSF